MYRFGTPICLPKKKSAGKKTNFATNDRTEISLWNALVIILTVKVFSKVKKIRFCNTSDQVELGCLKFQHAYLQSETLC